MDFKNNSSSRCTSLKAHFEHKKIVPLCLIAFYIGFVFFVLTYSGAFLNFNKLIAINPLSLIANNPLLDVIMLFTIIVLFWPNKIMKAISITTLSIFTYVVITILNLPELVTLSSQVIFAALITIKVIIL